MRGSLSYVCKVEFAFCLYLLLLKNIHGEALGQGHRPVTNHCAPWHMAILVNISSMAEQKAFSWHATRLMANLLCSALKNNVKNRTKASAQMPVAHFGLSHLPYVRNWTKVLTSTIYPKSIIGLKGWVSSSYNCLVTALKSHNWEGSDGTERQCCLLLSTVLWCDANAASSQWGRGSAAFLIHSCPKFSFLI